MKPTIALSLALAFFPALAFAGDAPPPGPPPDAVAPTAPTAQQRAQMEQFRAQARQSRIATRSNLLASLTPAHRSAVASLVGQLVLAPNPNYQAAVAQLDAILSPGEKQSIVNISTTERANMRALMEAHRAAMESTMTADERAKMADRDAKMQAFMQSHPRPAAAADPGSILLRTLGSIGEGPMHEHGM